ncbi:MAG TPA: TIGR00282 family metallophosphoesterase [Alphaproteobacteria bacterium]|nr:TIGR00282 family metallophosphoesterase [Alphaproteobacteria bacterium]
MRILFFGDIMGKSGREGLARHVPDLRARLKPDVVIANAENAAGGFGVTDKIAREFYTLGVDCLTTGNHAWDQKELLKTIDNDPKLLRPLNYPDGTPGRGSYLHVLADGRTILIVNVMARLFMEPALDDPFAVTERFLAAHKLGQAAQAILIDFHSEASSEKMAFAHFCDGRVSAVIGTHTHIPTADEQILPRGTAYLSDAGMCGDYDSVIGIRKELSLWRFVKKIPGERMAPAEGEATVCGAFVVTDDKTGLAVSIEPLRVGGRLRQRMPEA